MPRVTAAHRDAQRERLVDAAMLCFARDGFHATGMADVIAESGMSAGAVYGYVRSKDELIELVADRVLLPALQLFDTMLADGASPDPAALVEAGLGRVEQLLDSGPVDVSRIALQVWAEALRNDAIAATAERIYRGVRGYFVEAVRRAQEHGRLDAGLDPEVAGQVLFALLPGFILQRLLIGDVDAASYGAAARALLDNPGRAESATPATAPAPPRRRATGKGRPPTAGRRR